MMRSAAVAFMVAGAGAVRTQSAVWWDESQTADCVAEIRPHLPSINYRELFMPILAATYIIKEKNSGLYMCEHDFDVVAVDASTAECHWGLTIRSAAGTPEYLLKNALTQRYLAVNYGAGGVAETTLSDRLNKSHWTMSKNSDTDSYTIHNKFQNDMLIVSDGNLFVWSDFSLQSQWVLEEDGTNAGSRWFKEGQYKNQWKDNGMPLSLFPGAAVTWGDLCPGDTCEDAYIAERRRFLNDGLLVQSSRNVVTQNHVRGICDMPLGSLKQFAKHPEVIKSVQTLTPDSCPGTSLASFYGPFKQAIEEECFNGCIDAIGEVFPPKVSPPNCTTIDWAPIDRKIASDARCTGTPKDTAEGLKEFVANSRCFDFHAESVLWVQHDKSPWDLAAYDGEGTCSGDSKSTILLTGSCPEGSKCKCPRTYLKPRDTTDGIREDAKIGIWTSYSDNAAAGALASNFERKSPHFGFLKGMVSWHCRETVGCWPQKPEERAERNFGSSRACRMPAKAEGGGHPLWFLPPPMLRLKHSWGRCVLGACDEDHIAAQEVGLVASAKLRKYPGKVNLYNCQPLSWEDMSPDLKRRFLEKLRDTGLFVEYDEPPVE